MRWTMLTLVALLWTGACAYAQDNGQMIFAPPVTPPPVDQKDPLAVGRAYYEACQKGDAERALSLIVQVGPLADSVRQMGMVMRAGPEMQPYGLQGMLDEMALLPIGLNPAPATYSAQAEGDGTTVTVTQSPVVTRKVVLVKGEDGLWRVDLLRSIIGSTGHKDSVLVTQFQRMAGGGGGAPEDTDQQARQRISSAARALIGYAEAHGNTLPPAQTWTEDVAKYSLDPLVLRRPGLKDGECGYALNAQIAGQKLPDWPARSSTVLLFEVDDPAPNLVGAPDEDLPAKLANGKSPWVAMCDGIVVRATPEMTVSRQVEAWAHSDTCQRHLRALAGGLLQYARDHEGKLPPATSWCDDMPYLPPEPDGTQPFTCPAEPDFACGYAINRALAGRDIRTLPDHWRYVLLVHAIQGVRNEAVDVGAAAPVGKHRQRWAGEMEIMAMLNGNINNVPKGTPYPQPPAPKP